MIHHRIRSAPRLADTPRRQRVRRNLLWAVAGAMSLAAINGCGGSDDTTTTAPTGEQLFKTAFAGTNGRTCASCHVPEDNFALTADHATKLWETNPKDPLFAAIDADDPKAAKLTFDHLKKGLIRVWLALPDNMDQIDAEGNVVTPADRKIFVWRGVPSIADVALTAPYQLDGREATLESQAQGAVTGHSEGGTISASERSRIAEFQKTVFTSDRARSVADQLKRGIPASSITDPEQLMILTAEETRGRAVYNAVCAACHGGATKTLIVDRVVHAQARPALKPDGHVLYKTPVTNPPAPLLAFEPSNEFINIGSAVENYMAQIGKALGVRFTEHVAFTEDLSYPQYRFRFYKDATRKEVIADLPPALPAENPFQPREDSDGNPITGPNFTPQLYTTDPGRAAITGNPNDFEAFDIPSLRGVAKTGPYWHNNISATLEAVVSLYSDHLFSKFPTLFINDKPPVPDEDGDIGPVESLSEQQKSDLVAYLKRL